MRLAELERDEPLDLCLDFWLRGIRHDALDVEASESEARSVASSVDPLDLLEGSISAGPLLLQRKIMARSHLRMRIVARVGQLVARTDWVEELDGLISARSHYQLGLGQVANIKDGGVVRLDSPVARDRPRWPRLEQLDQVALQVPDQELTRLSRLASGLVLLVCILAALLELVR